MDASLEYLIAELERISALIKTHARYASELRTHSNPYPGLQITAQEVNNMLTESIGLPAWAMAAAQTDVHPTSTFVATEKTSDQSPRLMRLSQQFHLSPQEIDILLVCLLPEFDTRQQKLYAYLQDDINKKIPTVDFILNILSKDLENKFSLRKYFDHSAPLFDYGLLEFSEKKNNLPLLNHTVKVSERIINYLLNRDIIPQDLINILSIKNIEKSLQDLFLPEELKSRLNQLTEIDTKNTVIYLQGSLGMGKRTLASAICANLKIKLLVVDIQVLLDSKTEDLLPFIFREAVLQNAALYWRNVPLLFDKAHENFSKTLFKQLTEYKGIIFMDGESPWRFQYPLFNKWFIPILLPKLNSEAREQLWNQSLPAIAPESLTAVADRFELTPEQIKAAAHIATHLNQWNSLMTPMTITQEDLFKACHLQANHQLNQLACAVKLNYQRSDIILPDHCQQQLDEIITHVKHHAFVFEHWGFADKFSSGKGLNALFSGPPGTGKTMAAEVIATSLSLDLYKIDLSMIVSKYIGETEKNLSQIFSEAESSQIILFFDEADALFGKRSEVQDAHDRYANIETSYLLQKIEEYSGIVILATNFKRNMDEAFVRRLHFCIDFPFPTVAERLRIWESIWPKNVPLNADIDFPKLAQNLEITGGSIRNIVLSAAFKAAEENKVQTKTEVTMAHLIYAAQREFKKMGKVVREADFSGIF